MSVQTSTTSTPNLLYQQQPNALFNRDWLVSAYQYAPTGARDANGNAVYAQTGPKFLFSGPGYNQNLKVTFDIEKTQESQTSKGIIEIWNLNKDTRKQLSQKSWQITLEAGYVGYRHPIYIGDVFMNGVSVRREGPDIVTRIELGSFERQFETTILSRSYPPGTTFLAVLKDLAQTMGVDISVALVPASAQQTVFNQGYAVHRSIKRTLTDLCARFSLRWNIQDGELQILPKDAHSGEEAIVLNSGYDSNSQEMALAGAQQQVPILKRNTGLIDIPHIADTGLMRFSSLLNPYLMPGRLVQVISDNVNGFYSVMLAHFVGDSHGQKWQVDCEAFAVPELQTVPSVVGMLGG